MKTILYLMHIDWNWIKQRPQYIAEGLSKKYRVIVMYKHTYNNVGYQHRKSNLVELKEVYAIPNKFSNFKISKNVNDAIFTYNVKKEIEKNNVSIIYVTSPKFYKNIPKNFKGKIIYDCMDDHLLLGNPDKKDILSNEKKLLDISDKVIVTSIHLKNTLIKRYGVNNKNKFTLIRNGFKGPILKISQMNCVKSKNSTKIRIGYFGTVSEWFDFNLLEKSLRDFSNIEYKIWGPVDQGISIPEDFKEKIKFCGTVEHDELYKVVSDCDVLIMPFKLNEMIKSVDPVKLYEYINFDKNIVAIEYPEIERFASFVHFYSNYVEYKNILNFFEKNRDVSYSLKQRASFLRTNSWENRISKIETLIEEL